MAWTWVGWLVATLVLMTVARMDAQTVAKWGGRRGDWKVYKRSTDSQEEKQIQIQIQRNTEEMSITLQFTFSNIEKSAIKRLLSTTG